MYSNEDKVEIRHRIMSYSLRLVPVLAALIAGYVLGMSQRWEIWVMIDGVLIFSAICFSWALYLYPCIRYERFLRDMETGLTREMEGSVVEVAAQEDYQDGVRVLPVRIFLESEQDERIVYLNASKADGFPAPGTKVRLKCFGRHIKEVE